MENNLLTFRFHRDRAGYFFFLYVLVIRCSTIRILLMTSSEPKGEFIVFSWEIRHFSDYFSQGSIYLR